MVGCGSDRNSGLWKRYYIKALYLEIDPLILVTHCSSIEVDIGSGLSHAEKPT